jgi:hypothetical protein
MTDQSGELWHRLSIPLSSLALDRALLEFVFFFIGIRLALSTASCARRRLVAGARGVGAQGPKKDCQKPVLRFWYIAVSFSW